MPRKMPEELQAEVNAMLEAGLSPQDIAKEVGYTVDTIYKIRRELGFSGRHLDPLKGVDVDGVVEAYRSGAMMKEIREKYGVNSNQIYKILEMTGEPTRKYDPTHQEGRERQRSEAIEMYTRGFLIKEIVAETGISQTELHSLLFARKIPLRRPSMSREVQATQNRGRGMGEAGDPSGDVGQ